MRHVDMLGLRSLVLPDKWACVVANAGPLTASSSYRGRRKRCKETDPQEPETG